jgi:aspartokinase-like uncharacterized kinase
MCDVSRSKYKIFANKTKIPSTEYLQELSPRVVVENKTEQLTKQDLLEQVIILPKQLTKQDLLEHVVIAVPNISNICSLKP